MCFNTRWVNIVFSVQFPDDCDLYFIALDPVGARKDLITAKPTQPRTCFFFTCTIWNLYKLVACRHVGRNKFVSSLVLLFYVRLCV